MNTFWIVRSSNVFGAAAMSVKPLFWLALPLAALWPMWRWSLARLTDGSDDPLGVLALLALSVFLYRDRCHLRAYPDRNRLLFSVLLAAIASISAIALPWLLRSVLAIGSVMAMIAALRGPQRPMLPFWGLGLLALPVLSSLQFFIGYPLRVITAQMSVWLFSAFAVSAELAGCVMTVNGQLIVVDAPCSGIQMAWFAYFVACIVGCWLTVPDRVFLHRLPWVGLVVLMGNIVRNTILAAGESGLFDHLAWKRFAWLHEATGLVVFTVVCIWVVRHMARPFGNCGHSSSSERRRQTMPTPLAATVAIASFTLYAFMPLFLVGPSVKTAVSSRAIEWPRQIDGHELRPLALSPVEQRFAEQFPGSIARMTDGERLYTLRHVTLPTRKLHPAEDCFRALGYRIESTRLVRQALAGGAHEPARCFIAGKENDRMQICEQIIDARGRVYADTSAWYWNALFDPSAGPWRAVTVAQATSGTGWPDPEK